MRLVHIQSSWGEFSLAVDFIGSIEQIRESLKTKAYAPLVIHEVEETTLDQANRRQRAL